MPPLRIDLKAAGIDPARLADIDGVFERVLEVPPSERPRALERECGGDSALRREVERLLAADEESETFLFDRTGGALDGAFGASVARGLARSSSMPRRVGPFRPIRELGQGGMAVVYLAERIDGLFEQQVALKLVRGGDRDQVASLLKRERRILASLEHPAIARILDGGVTEEGEPYFAMERIDGLAIDEHCDRHRLEVRQRLALFIEVARAVAYAHRRLVVHRDLKPSNILVTEDGRIKLLDFGIATLVESSAAPRAPGTLAPWMTLQWASPEQLRGEPISTAADLYQLGLLLYKLLTGREPYTVERRTPSQVEQVICREPVVPPSRRARRGDVDADVFRTTVSALARRLAGDLDTIVLMALRKEPGRRYATAELMIEDVERHLRGLPVAAHPDSPSYRLGKWLGRHRLAAAMAVLAGLLGLHHAWIVTQRNRVVEQERDRAQAAALKAETIQGFLIDLFEKARPEADSGDDLTVREVLDRGVGRIEYELRDQPAIQTALLAASGDIYRSLGLFDQSEALLERALTLADERTSEPLEGAENRLRLARLRSEQGRHEKAIALLSEALKIREARLGEDHPAVAEALDALGGALVELRRFDEAEPLLRRSLLVRESHFGRWTRLSRRATRASERWPGTGCGRRTPPITSGAPSRSAAPCRHRRRPSFSTPWAFWPTWKVISPRPRPCCSKGWS